MAASVRFELGGFEWSHERQGVLFVGQAATGLVGFLITAEALAELLNPDRDAIDRDTAIETFIEFEANIHRIAHREFVSRLGGEPPIVLTAADVAD